MFDKVKKFFSKKPSEEWPPIPFDITPTDLAKLMCQFPALIDHIGSSVDKVTLNTLIHQAKPNPLALDVELWFKFIPYAVKHSLFLYPKIDIPKVRAHSILKPLLPKVESVKAAIGISEFIMHDELTDTEADEIINDCTNILISSPSELTYNWHTLFYSVPNPKILKAYIEHEHEPLATAALKVITMSYGSNPWIELYPFARKNPHTILELFPSQMDMWLWRPLFESGDAKVKRRILDEVLSLFMPTIYHNKSEQDVREAFEFFNELYENDTDYIFGELCSKAEGFGGFGAAGIQYLKNLEFDEINNILIALLSMEQFEIKEEEKKLVKELLNALPATIVNVPKAKLPSIVSCMSEKELIKSSEFLLPILAKGTSQSLRHTLAKVFSNSEPELLEQLGWLNKKSKSVQEVCVEVLLAHPSSDKSQYLYDLAKSKKLSLENQDRILDYLENSGVDVTEIDEMGDRINEFVKEHSEKLNRIPKVVENVYSDQLSKSLSSFSNKAVQWLLVQLSGSAKELTRSARKILNHCSANERNAFTEELTKIWIEKEGDLKLKWLLKPLEIDGSNKVASILFDAVSLWYRNNNAQSKVAINSLATMGSDYSLSKIKVISETEKYPDSIHFLANTELSNAAKSRGISILELFEVLVPDYGLDFSNELVLDVGPYAYQIKLKDDLTLRVATAQGKETKTFPKLKENEDSLMHKTAKATFTKFKNNIKDAQAHFLTQLPKLQMGAKTWSRKSWTMLFLEHPVHSKFLETIIWSAHNEKNEVQYSFRVSKEHGIILEDGNNFELNNQNKVSIWHPAHQTEKEIADWQNHLNNNGLVPIIEQTKLVIHHWNEEWVAKEDYILIENGKQFERESEIYVPFRGHAFSLDMLRNFTTRYGYRAGPTEKKGYIYSHTLNLNDAQLQIILFHTGMNPDRFKLSRIAISAIEIFSGPRVGNEETLNFLKGLHPRTLQSATLSILLSQLQELSDEGYGYDEDWESL